MTPSKHDFIALVVTMNQHSVRDSWEEQWNVLVYPQYPHYQTHKSSRLQVCYWPDNNHWTLLHDIDE